MEFFAGANTRYGFKSLFEETFKNIQRLYILKGSSGCGKSTLMKRIAGKAQKLNLPNHIIYCSADPDSLDGVILPTLGIAVADGTAPHVMDVKYPCVRESIINLGQFWDEGKLLPHRSEIMWLTDLKGCHYKNAYRILASAGNMGELEKDLLSQCINRKKCDNFAFKLAEKIMGDKKGEATTVFASAFTSKGIKTIPLFENVKTVYKIIGKGGPELLKSLAQIAAEAGTKRIICANPIDPDDTDALYFPETAILVSSENGIYSKNAKEQHSVSTARFLDKSKTQAIKNRIAGLEKLQKELLAEAMNELTSAKEVHGKIEDIYIPAMDFSAMDEFTFSLSKSIFGE